MRWPIIVFFIKTRAMLSLSKNDLMTATCVRRHATMNNSIIRNKKKPASPGRLLLDRANEWMNESIYMLQQVVHNKLFRRKNNIYFFSWGGHLDAILFVIAPSWSWTPTELWSIWRSVQKPHASHACSSCQKCTVDNLITTTNMAAK